MEFVFLNAKSYSFKHNNINEFKNLNWVNISRKKNLIVTEVVFSMDGDSPDFNHLFK